MYACRTVRSHIAHTACLMAALAYYASAPAHYLQAHVKSSGIGRVALSYTTCCNCGHEEEVLIGARTFLLACSGSRPTNQLLPGGLTYFGMPPDASGSEIKLSSPSIVSHRRPWMLCVLRSSRLTPESIMTAGHEAQGRRQRGGTTTHRQPRVSLMPTTLVAAPHDW